MKIGTKQTYLVLFAVLALGVVAVFYSCNHFKIGRVESKSRPYGSLDDVAIRDRKKPVIKGGNPLSFCRPGRNPTNAIQSLQRTYFQGTGNDVYHPIRAIDFFPEGNCIASQSGRPDSDGRFKRVRILRTEFKYPYIRVEEEVVRHPGSKRNYILSSQAMVADHVIVKRRAGVAEKEFKTIIESSGNRVLREIEVPGMYLIGLDEHEADSVPKGVAACGGLTDAVAYAEPDYIHHIEGMNIPNDPGLGKLWGLHNDGRTGGAYDADIDAPEAWADATGSSNVVVGVIDTGIDYTHPELAPNMWVNVGETGVDAEGFDRASNGVDDDGNGYVDDVHGYDFVNNDGDPMDDHFHGTHCAGTIGARGNNSRGIAGVCWRVRLMGLKFLSDGGYGTASDALRALYYAIQNGADLTSNSWGGGGSLTAMEEAIAEAEDAGQVFIAAAGNSAMNNDYYPHYPSSYTNLGVIAVAATDHSDNLATFSCWGHNSVDLAAPGVDIYSTFPQEPTFAMQLYGLAASYGSISGTSMATPHVAGAAALLLALQPDLNPTEIREHLLFRVDPIKALMGKTSAGGRLNIATMVNADWVPAPASLEFLSITMDDEPEGNGNGYPEAGETIDVYLNYANTGQTAATGVTSAISISNTSVEILSGEIMYEDIPGMQSRSSETAFRIYLPEGANDGQQFFFKIDTAYNNMSTTNEIRVIASVFEPVAIDDIPGACPTPALYLSEHPEMVADPARDRMYILTREVESFQRLLAIDASTGDCRTVGRVSCPAKVMGLDVAQDGSQLFAALKDGRLQVLSLPELRHVRYINLSERPTGLVYGDGDKLCTRLSENYQSGSKLFQIDLHTGAQDSRLESWGGRLRRSSDAREFYETIFGIWGDGWGTVNVVDAADGKPLRYDREYLIFVLFTSDFNVDREYDRAYVTCGLLPWLQVNQDNEYIYFWEIPGGGLGLQGVAYRSDCDYIYARTFSGNVRKYLRDDGTPLADYKVPGWAWSGPSLRLARNGKVFSIQGVANDSMAVIGANNLELETFPLARFSADQKSAKGFEFDASNSEDPQGGEIEYEWSFGDGTAAIGMIVSHEYPSNGTYTVTLSVVNEDGIADRLLREYLVTDNEPPVAEDDLVSTACGRPISIDVMNNDYDPDEGPQALHINSLSQPENGYLQLNGNTVRYIPTAEFEGVDSFGYEVSDGLAIPDPATVTVTVTNNIAYSDLAHAGLTGDDSGFRNTGQSRELLDGTWEIWDSYEQMVVTGDFEVVVRLLEYEIFSRDNCVDYDSMSTLVNEEDEISPLADIGPRSYEPFAGLRIETVGPQDPEGRRYNALGHPPQSNSNVKLAWKVTDIQGLGTSLSEESYQLPDMWMRMTRAGDMITTYASADGTNWNQQGMVTIDGLGEALRVGISSAKGDGPIYHDRAIFDNFEVTPIVSAPTCTVASVTPPGGEFQTKTIVEMETSESDAYIYYTLDGTTPSTCTYSIPYVDDPQVAHRYTGPFMLRESATIKARVFRPGSYPSGTASNHFTIIPPPIPPTITSQPEDQIVYAGANAHFEASVSGTPAPSCQWYHNGMRIAGATHSEFAIDCARYEDLGEYRVLVSSSAGSIWSETAMLSIEPRPDPELDAETAAGSGIPSAVDGVSANAGFNFPADTALNTSKFVYIADAGNNVVRLMTPFGDVSTFAGDGTAGLLDGTSTNARFKSPQGIAVDASNNVYLADTGNHCIRLISATGTVNTVAGTGTAGYSDGACESAQFNGPQGIALDDAGNIYVADTGNHCIRKVTTSGQVSTIAGLETAGFADGAGANARFDSPGAIAVDAEDVLYVADTGNNRVRRISPSGEVTTMAGQATAGYQDGVGANAQFNAPAGIAVTRHGRILVGDGGNHTIRAIDTDKRVKTLVGTGEAGYAEGTPADAMFNSPRGLSVDTTGDIYVADRNNHRIRHIWVPLEIEWVSVGYPGNPDDPATGCGSVAVPYRIGKYEVTCAEYVKFLNAVAKESDRLGLYQIDAWDSMGENPRCGVARVVGDDGYYYFTKPNMADKPVGLLELDSAKRMANWLHNGQPKGVQDSSTTEQGSYDMSNDDGYSGSKARKWGGAVFLPSENQWYKAAYYQPASEGGDTDGYWSYPTRTNAMPIAATASEEGEISNPGANVANYNDGASWNGLTGNVTTVGSAGPESCSFFGTYDQAGNVMERTDTIAPSPVLMPIVRGGSYLDNYISSSHKNGLASNWRAAHCGFRLAAIPMITGLSSNISFSSTADSYVQAGGFADENYGNESTLEMEVHDTVSDKEAYIKFDLSALTNTVLSASLKVYCEYLSSSTTVQVCSIGTDGWKEDEITWNNRPADATGLGSLQINSAGNYIQFDATDFIGNTLATDKVATFRLSMDEGQTANCGLSSFEGGIKGPVLEIIRKTDSSEGVNLAPACSASADRVWGLAPLTVQFEGAGGDVDGEIAGYEWNFDDGSVAKRQNTEHTFTESGDYAVIFTVTDNDGAQDNAAINIEVQERAEDELILIGDLGNIGEQSRLDKFGDTNYYGGVAYNYEISKHEITTAEFVEFLNSTAKRDISQTLWDDSFDFADREGAGSENDPFVWKLKSNAKNDPVERISWFMAARYVNWLHNGRPDLPVVVTGLLENVTEAGVYDMSLPQEDIHRNADATWALPTENEWYKAAHYRPATKSYIDGPSTGAGPWGMVDHANMIDEWTETLHSDVERRTRDAETGTGVARWAAGWEAMTRVSDLMGLRLVRMVDTDGDGLTDRDEALLHGSDPEKSDTDGDGFNDQEEVESGSDPADADFHPGPPVITSQPGDAIVPTGDHAAFEVGVKSAPSPVFQWQCRDMKVWSGDESRLNIPAANSYHVGSYRVIVSNQYGSVTSAPAYLTLDATPVPGVLEAEDYKECGEGVGYHDATIGNEGGVYRQDDVDIGEITESLSVEDGGYYVGWIAAGEWLAYDVSVQETASYDMFVRVASEVEGVKEFHMDLNGETLVDSVTFTNAAGAQVWEDILINGLELEQGEHEIRIVMDTGGFNLDRIELESGAGDILAKPSFDPDGGILAGPAEVTISCPDTDAVVYYTTDGTAPNSADRSGAAGLSVTIDHPMTLRAIATAPNRRSSEVKSSAFTMADNDWDGIPDWWESRYGVSSTSIDPNGDMDKDGMNNRAEWVANTDPTDPASRLAFTSVRVAENSDALIFEWQSASNRSYSLQIGANLYGQFETQRRWIPASAPLNCLTVPVENVEGSFYRLEVEE